MMNNAEMMPKDVTSQMKMDGEAMTMDGKMDDKMKSI